MNIADAIHFAKKVNNRLSPASVWDSVTQHQFVVPGGKRWIVIGGAINRNAAETVSTAAYDLADNIIVQIDYQSAAASTTVWPSTAASGAIPQFPFGGLVLDSGEYIRLTFGGNQGAGAWITCMVLELSV